MSDDVVVRVRQAVCAGLAPHGRLVLAVSGGADSSVLLDAAAALAPERVVAVATFDHRTGRWGAHAVRAVATRCAELGLPFEGGRAPRSLAGAGEAAWRRERWSFLRSVAQRLDARIVTAHTRDDQVETVFLRTLRGAGARGLAGLLAASDIVRPMLGLGRADVDRYVAARALSTVDDPSNRSRAHLRNRARLDLLPLLRGERPALADELLAIGERAAEWRRETDALVDHLGLARRGAAALVVAPDALTRYDAEVLSILWPAIAARAGVALDWRGTRRLTEFTRRSVPGQRMPLSGGFEVVRRRDAFALRPATGAAPASGALPYRGAPEAALTDVVRFGDWRFAPADAAGSDPWTAELPADRPLRIRAWRPGDRMRAGTSTPARRVKRFLADARVPVELRAGWPVVLAGSEIVWIPGVRRSRAATDRSGRPGLTYTCERNDDAV
jgi:tRNA(Ile)-lysidine synthase